MASCNISSAQYGHFLYFLFINFILFPHRPTHTKYSDDNSGADKTEEAVGVDVEDFLGDDVSIKTDTTESYPIDYFRWFRGHTHETPDGEERDDRIDDESEVGEGDTCDHRIWMDDDIWAWERLADITCARDGDSCDRMEELVGSVAEIDSVSECDESEHEDEDVFVFHTS